MFLALLALAFVLAGALSHEHAGAAETPAGFAQHMVGNHDHDLPSDAGHGKAAVCCDALAAMCAGAMLRPDEIASTRPSFDRSVAWPVASIAPAGRNPEAESPPPRV